MTLLSFVAQRSPRLSVAVLSLMELVELTLISVMTLAPQQREQMDIKSALTGVD